MQQQRRGGFGVRHSVCTLIDCLIAYPLEKIDDELVLKEELVLVSRPYIDDQHWRSGFDDSLRSCEGPSWTRIRVRKADVAAAWPFVLDEASYRSGNPGRPSARPYVIKEYVARCEAGEMGQNQRADAKVLEAWLSEEHPKAPSAQWQAIERMIQDYRESQNATLGDSK